MPTPKKFHLILVRPTRYDDEGYPMHWVHELSTPAPSNSLACMYGIALDCRDRFVLGQEVEIAIHALDEVDGALNRNKFISTIKKDGGHGLLALVGVQSNQFPRALDLAKPFVEANIPACIGGFHVSGCLAMFPEPTPELKMAMGMGISLFSGEAEERRFDQVLIDAWSNKLKPLYDYTNNLPGLEGQPLPYLPAELLEKGPFRPFSMSTIDLGRGCPFVCSFCCIINVQGHKSRFRSVADLERVIRFNHDIKTNHIFITDDNFARNKNWEAFLDKLIELRKEGLKVSYTIQVDTLCHRIPRFVEKAVMAGICNIFVGIENINPDNLAAVNKRQNKISHYKEMLLAWKKYPVSIIGAYIIGLPNDTKDSILQDIETIKRELPIDILNLSILTPLPGSQDHQNMVEQGIWMDPDLNKYDLTHRVTHHPKMTDEELDEAYEMAWNSFYSLEHMEVALRRLIALRGKNHRPFVLGMVSNSALSRVYGIRSYNTGLLRKKDRKDRRPGLPLENPLAFYLKYFSSTIKAVYASWRVYRYLWKKLRQIANDPERMDYKDMAITPSAD